MSLFRRTVARLLAATLVFSGMSQAAPAPLALIGTEQAAVAMQAVAPSETHAKLAAALDRADLAAALQARGVTQRRPETKSAPKGHELPFPPNVNQESSPDSSKLFPGAAVP